VTCVSIQFLRSNPICNPLTYSRRSSVFIPSNPSRATMSKSLNKKGAKYPSKSKQKSSPNLSKSAKSPKANVAPPDDENRIFTRFVWIGNQTHSRTPIYFYKLTLRQLLEKVDLELFNEPPSAQQIFEIYFKEDIFPHIRCGIQSKINNKKDIAKLWEVQSNTLQSIYADRAEILKAEWAKKVKSKKVSAQSHLTEEEKETMRKKAEQKARNEAAKLKRKEEMERLISSGAFDEKPSKSAKSGKSKKSEKSKKSSKSKKAEQEQHAKSQRKREEEERKRKEEAKTVKAVKKKKGKKWKEKKSRKQSTTEQWPAMKGSSKSSKSTPKMTPEIKAKSAKRTESTATISGAQPIRNDMDRNDGHSAVPRVGAVPSEQPVPALNGYPHGQPLHSVYGQYGGHHPVHHQSARNGYHHPVEQHRNGRERMVNHRKMVRSQLRFKLVVRSESEEYVLRNGPDVQRQMDGLQMFIERLHSVNELLWIKIWIYCDLNVPLGQDLWLCTDREHVNVTLNQSKLFEIIWSDFGHAVKRRIDSPNIKTVYVRKTNALRLKVPILSL